MLKLAWKVILGSKKQQSAVLRTDHSNNIESQSITNNSEVITTEAIVEQKLTNPARIELCAKTIWESFKACVVSEYLIFL